MARAKKEKPEVMKTYETTIRYRCPNRGWVEEKVKIKKYKEKEVPTDTIDTSSILGENIDEEEYSDDVSYDD